MALVGPWILEHLETISKGEVTYTHPPALKGFLLGAHPPDPLAEGDTPSALPHNDVELIT